MAEKGRIPQEKVLLQLDPPARQKKTQMDFS